MASFIIIAQQAISVSICSPKVYMPLEPHHVHALDRQAVIDRKALSHHVPAVKLCGPRIDESMGCLVRSLSEADFDLVAS